MPPRRYAGTRMAYVPNDAVAIARRRAAAAAATGSPTAVKDNEKCVIS